MTYVAHAAFTIPHNADVERVVSLEPDPSILNAIGRGHTLTSAIADIIDNSLDAGAERINVRFLVRRDEVVGLRIRDDGRGMSSFELQNAMTLGKRREYESNALGHFGVGLKASSLSQARVFTVYTRCASEPAASMRMRRPAGSGTFDAEVLTASASRNGFEFDQRVDLMSTGTVIEWDGLDNVSASGIESVRRTWLNSTITTVRGELGLTFHRLIAQRHVRIEIDEYDLELEMSGVPRTVEAIDPFGFQLSGKSGYPAEVSGSTSSGAALTVKCFVLPPNSQAPSARLLGRSRADWQGIYVYRNDRLLQAGGWHSITGNSAELQLARAVIDLTPELLADVTMNPEKSGVLLRPAIVHAIEGALDSTGDITFHAYLDAAREIMQVANKREVRIKPVTPLADGLSDDLVATIAEHLGHRTESRPASIKWRLLEEGRLFQFDSIQRTLWLNAGYRRQLTGSQDDAPNDAPLLKMTLFLLMESQFARDRVQQSTLDQVEAWQSVLASAMSAQIDVLDYDPFAAEDNDTLTMPPAPGDGSDVADPVDSAGAPASDGMSRHPVPGPYVPRLKAQDVPPPAGNDPESTEPDVDAPFDDFEDLSEPIVGATKDQISDYLKQIGTVLLLNAEEEVDLAKRIEIGLFAEEKLDLLVSLEKKSALGRELAWLARDGRRANAHLTSANLRLVVSIAKKNWGRGLDLLDLIQEGNLGLIRAVEKFDYTLGFKFSTYATWWIRQALSRSLADTSRTIRIPVHMVEQLNKLRVVMRKLATSSPHIATFQEIADEAQLTVAEVKVMLSYDRPLISLDEIIATDFDGFNLLPVNLADVLVDEEQESAYDRVEPEIVRWHIDYVLDRLSDREAGVIRMRFGLDGDGMKTLDQIGDVYSVTRERIRQIEGKTMAKLRHPSFSDELRDFLPGAGATSRRGAPRSAPTPSSAVADQPSPVTSLVAPEVDPAEDFQLEMETSVRMFDSLVVEVPDLVSDDAPTEPDSAGDKDFIDLYRQGLSIPAIAHDLGVDDRVVAIRLTRVLLDGTGDLDDETTAPRHGIPYTPDERTRILLSYGQGHSFMRIAGDLGRTPLAIAWQLFDSPKRPVHVTRKILKSLRRRTP
ncbi:sigma-70 family RNA polymerase sigma factor [Cryobacterium sp. TMT1-66-1]|nr:sigma-70 family RNA polymerase sigma factor [Cryobacterium sp. TMT1-66-1]